MGVKGSPGKKTLRMQCSMFNDEQTKNKNQLFLSDLMHCCKYTNIFIFLIAGKTQASHVFNVA